MDTEQQRNALTTSDRPTTLGLSPALAHALTELDAAEIIAAAPNLIAEARDRLPILRARLMSPATLMDLKEIIGRRFVTYPQSVRSATEWEMWWSDYETALIGLSAEAVNAGIEAWIAKPESEFLPKPGRLRELALQTATPTGLTVGVLRSAIDADNRREAEARAARRDFEVTPVRLKHIPKPREDREAVRGMMDEFRVGQVQRATEKPRPVMRETHGSLAPGHHVTAETLALVARHNKENAALRDAARGILDA